MKKLTCALLTATLALGLLAGCGKKDDSLTVKVGASPAPHAEILEVVKEELAKQDINLEIVEFNDYVLPNTSLEDGSIDANYFQHITYLNDFNDQNGTHLVSLAEIHYEPLAIYAGKAASLADLKDGDQIAVPNDGTNEARALRLLEANGLITLREDADLTATKDDIEENPHNYEIVELEASQLPSRRADVALAVINGNYALSAGLTNDQAVAFEDAAKAAAPFVNVLAVKDGSQDRPEIKALAEALTSEAVRTHITETYGDAVVPAF